MSFDRQSLLFHFFDVVLNIVIIIAVVAIVRTFIVSPFQIDGNSMMDTLLHREYIVINKFRYLFQHPIRGDIVVFRPPSDPYKYYVKRVIGLPGETIVVRDGLVYVRNDKNVDIKLPEPYLNASNAGKTYRYPVTSGDTREEIFVVPRGEYFVLGDNRQGSLDSRSFAHVNSKDTPFIPRDHIKGNVWFIALPVSKMQTFGPQNYQL